MFSFTQNVIYVTYDNISELYSRIYNELKIICIYSIVCKRSTSNNTLSGIEKLKFYVLL